MNLPECLILFTTVSKLILKILILNVKLLEKKGNVRFLTTCIRIRIVSTSFGERKKKKEITFNLKVISLMHPLFRKNKKEILKEI